MTKTTLKSVFNTSGLSVGTFMCEFNFTDSIAKLVAAGKDAGKPLGRVVANSAEGIEAYKQGFDLIAVSGDCWLLQEAMTKASSELKAGCS